MEKALKKILVVDDSMFVREYMKEALSDRYEIITAADGDEAVRKYKAVRPDMVLLDITMPVEGISALRAIRDFDADAKVIMVSAIGTRKNVKESLKLGALDFIIKPFDISELAALLDKRLRPELEDGED